MSVRRLLPVLVGVALALGTFAVPTETATAQSSRRHPTIRMLSPKKGDVFRPGDVVTVTWEFVFPDGQVPTGDTAWCEQEIYLSLDGGRTNDRRVTLRLSPDVRSVEWTVPNTPTDNAVLDIHYGCETAESPAEVPNVQRNARFRILPADKHIDEIRINRLPKTVAPGTTLSVSWNAKVADGGAYHVFVSYDRGNEFAQIGETFGTSYDFEVPIHYRGPLTFRVVNHKPDGTLVESVIEPRNTTSVR